MQNQSAQQEKFTKTTNQYNGFIHELERATQRLALVQQALTSEADFPQHAREGAYDLIEAVRYDLFKISDQVGEIRDDMEEHPPMACFKAQMLKDIIDNADEARGEKLMQAILDIVNGEDPLVFTVTKRSEVGAEPSTAVAA